ncbi:uncharacterized protein LOC131619658 [Vicia villosa]|uniref:uncharacterized protein LOC131619658 n=1 Tax=Vicia villosa TaxID=3911 RepID=UPI00273B8AA6|nr:uncharacterized protein LOC131619658 [Vicia villosa]
MLVSWNVRQLNNSDNLREISSHLSNLNPDICILLETRVKSSRVSLARNKLKQHDRYLDNYSHHPNGRIWVSWRSCNIEICLDRVGDFNNVIRRKDRIGGRMVDDYEFHDLQSMMDICNFAKMENQGYYNTWHNKHEKDPIYFRIDRILGNSTWFLNLELQLTHLPPSVSDYEVVATNWSEPISGSPPFILWEKLKRLRRAIRKLSKPLTDVQRNILSAKEGLDQIQHNLSRDLMNPYLIHKVKEKTMEIIRWQESEEKVLQHKAKVEWIKPGDGNNHYFHASLKAKTNSKRLKKVCMEDGTKVTDKQGIEDMVLNFMSSSLDGYSPEFFKSCWKIMKEDLICTIRYWFRTNTMFKGFNNNLVTLTPKFPEAKKLKDYRPISRCSIVYKIYSKILTSRITKEFSNSTGLVVNPAKCFVYMGDVDDSTREQILHTIGFRVGQLPFRYLGLPLSSKKLSINYYLPLIDKILSRIHNWSSKLLSLSGRVQLVKAVSFVITNYWLKCFLIPKNVIKRINSACRTFVWISGSAPSRKRPIYWKDVCKPKVKGGLNILDFDC